MFLLALVNICAASLSKFEGALVASIALSTRESSNAVVANSVVTAVSIVRARGEEDKIKKWKEERKKGRKYSLKQ